MSSKITKSGPNVSYQALSLISRLFYEKFGPEAIPIIRDVWYEMGLVTGERLKEKTSARDFNSAANALKNMADKMGDVYDLCEISEDIYHARTKSGYACDVGLEDAGRPICEAVMSVNQGQFKALCGEDVEMNIVKCRAAGDDCCEIIYRPKGT